MRNWMRPAAAIFAVTIASPALAAGTASHTIVVAGQARGTGTFGCATSGPQARERGFFNTGVGTPTEGLAACSLAGGIVDTASATNATVSNQSLSSAFNAGIATLSADAKAGFGSLGVSAKGSFTGFSDGFTYEAAEAAAYFNDLVPVPLGAVGTFNFGFTIDGNAMTAGNSQVITALSYRFGSDPIYSAFYSNVDLRSSTYAISPTSGSGLDLSGFVVSPGSVSGSGTVFTYETPVPTGGFVDLTLGLYTASYPGPFTGIANSNFLSTAKLTSILFRDAAGNPIDFSARGASGTLYDRFGAHSAVAGVPEPTSWALMILGFGIVGGALRQQRLRTRFA